MATNSEKIDELYRLLDQLVGRVNTIERDLEHISERVEKLRTADEDLRLRVHTLEREAGDIKKSREEWGRRAWALVGPLVGAVIGGIVTYLVKR